MAISDVMRTASEVNGVIQALRQKPIGAPRTLHFLETARGYAKSADRNLAFHEEFGPLHSRGIKQAQKGIDLINAAATDETLPPQVRAAALEVVPSLEQAITSSWGSSNAYTAKNQLDGLILKVKTGALPADPPRRGDSHALPEDREGRIRVLHSMVDTAKLDHAAAKKAVDAQLGFGESVEDMMRSMDL